MRSRKKFPIYCPLKFSFDPDRLFGELIALEPAFEPIPTTKANLDRRHEWFRVADEYCYAEVEHTAPTPQGVRVIAGKVPSWYGLSLTHVPGQPETRWGSSRYRRRFDGRWRWKSGLELPYTRSLIAALPFKRLDVVRVMTLPKGGFGPVHVDAPDDRPWEEEGIASITLMPRDGGVPMHFLASDGRRHEARDPVFFFKDCAPHGVPLARARRLLLRINGVTDPTRVISLMRLESAVW